MNRINMQVPGTFRVTVWLKADPKRCNGRDVREFVVNFHRLDDAIAFGERMERDTKNENTLVLDVHVDHTKEMDCNSVHSAIERLHLFKRMYCY